MKVQEKAPGKLFLAGEYAVVETGYPALIAAMDQMMTVTIESGQDDVGTLHSSQQEELVVEWQRQDGQLVFSANHPYTLIESAMQVAEEYARLLGRKTQSYYQVKVDSELDHAASGTKYGLGSSGAVTVATIKGILSYYGVNTSPLEIYKLAVLAQMRLAATGSFGDMAASSFGGVIAYSSPDRTWLRQVMAELSIKELVNLKWRDLEIRQVQLPSSIQLMVGWTGSSASTDQLVQQMTSGLNELEKEAAYRHFLAASKQCVHSILESCQADDALGFAAGILENRSLLQDFSKAMGLVVETPLLQTLCEVALGQGAPAKSSGAGGGDCGICFVTNPTMRSTIAQEWRQKGIQPLTISIAPRA